MEERILDFLESIEITKSYSPHTISAYRNDLFQFYQFVENWRPRVSSWGRVNRFLLQEYVKHLNKRRYSAASIARKIAALKSFYQYLLENRVVTEDPTVLRLENAPRLKRGVPKTLTGEQVQKLLAAPAQGGAPKNLRDLALLEVLYATGMRVTELISLNQSDVDPEEHTIRCAGPSHARVLPLTDRAYDALAQYLTRGRPRLIRDEKQPALFVNPRGERLTRQGLWLLLKAYVQAAGIDGNVTPHTLRHSFAMHMLRQGADLTSVQKWLGHTSLSTTQMYTRGHAGTAAEPKKETRAESDSAAPHT